MVSVLPRTSVIPTQDLDSAQLHCPFNELGNNLTDAVEPFTRAIQKSGLASVKLYCAVPTWAPPNDPCFDLHDLHELRGRCILFLHEMLQSLRLSGMQVTYNLVPCEYALCLISASAPDVAGSQVKSCALDLLRDSQSIKRENIILAQLSSYPSLIIT
ncbi:hypothetical protein CYLTODRAFT_418689 [Cylindrobasidium torrendii FP15055 ss-10]|uniref:Uncharacterized protein n=1 Tax=Cylindrobasidium torrendii FP15055 ss-10 TaxID=1314674 RepID=A0A0D7BMB4_9AGAR|nr:hypothetical protein CYLTODRAFT_418689 [Cylindrobasidium torrendii FP15055 ss-10]